MSGLSSFRSKQPGWFKINEGETKTIFVPFELNETPRHVVHSNPKDYTKSAVCTWTGPGTCYPCDKGTFQWTGRVKIYIPIYENNRLVIATVGTGVNSLFWRLSERFQAEGTSVGWYEITKKGKGKRAKYILKPIDKTFPVGYTSKVNMSSHVKMIDYENQSNYYS